MRSWQKWFIGQGTPLLTQELRSRGELQSEVMEDGDTTTHALQGECKTYRGCQSSGVTDSDSERQHEINMAVQTVQGRGHTHCREGGTETHTLAQTHLHAPLQNTAQGMHGAGLPSSVQDSAHTIAASSSHTPEPQVHTRLRQKPFLSVYVPADHRSLAHTSRLTFIPAEPALYLSQHPPAVHTGSDLSLTEDFYLLTILSAGVEANRLRKDR